MYTTLSGQKIHEIVEKDYVFAQALYFFGVKFYDYSEDTLEQLSQAKGFTAEQVIRKMDTLRSEEIPGPDCAYRTVSGRVATAQRFPGCLSEDLERRVPNRLRVQG